MEDFLFDGEERLLDLAREAAAMAYAPYSGVRVGAALEAEDGKVFTGCNVENASYGLSVCAERVAVFTAVANGVQTFRRLAVYSSTGKPLYPCGACLQVISEFSDDLELIICGAGGVYRRCVLSSLLPHPTRLEGAEERRYPNDR